jgi:hypothetical protein
MLASLEPQSAGLGGLVVQHGHPVPQLSGASHEGTPVAAGWVYVSQSQSG